MKMHARDGLTLIEVLVANMLMAWLAVLLATTWVGVGRPAVAVTSHGRLVQEMAMAAASLARDLGGSLPDAAARCGPKTQSRFVGWMLRGTSQLWLCFDGGDDLNGTADWAAPDAVVVYLVDSGRLVRWDQNAGTTFVVARCVTGMNLDMVGDDLRIRLSFTDGELVRWCTFIARAP